MLACFLYSKDPLATSWHQNSACVHLECLLGTYVPQFALVNLHRGEVDVTHTVLLLPLVALNAWIGGHATFPPRPIVGAGWQDGCELTCNLTSPLWGRSTAAVLAGTIVGCGTVPDVPCTFASTARKPSYCRDTAFISLFRCGQYLASEVY
jgi:hypothetical protein